MSGKGRSMCKIDGVILAAGLSKRMGTNKLLLPLGDATILDRFLERFPFARFDNVILVYSDEQVAAIAGRFPMTLCPNRQPRCR